MRQPLQAGKVRCFARPQAEQEQLPAGQAQLQAAQVAVAEITRGCWVLLRLWRRLLMLVVHLMMLVHCIEGPDLAQLQASVGEAEQGLAAEPAGAERVHRSAQQVA